MNGRRLLPALVIAVTLGSLVSPGLAPQAAADEFTDGCPRALEHTTPAGTVPATKRPVVLVHGWNGNSDGMYPVELGIEGLAPAEFAFRYFDYRADNQRWPDEPGTADCLALYVHTVSRAYSASGGDGRVLIVAHSMGGLITRYATNQAQPGDRWPRGVRDPISAEELAGVVTVDTPHLGSPFGGLPGSIQQGREDYPLNWFFGYDFPDNGTRAGQCLAVHDETTRLPGDCTVPPYFPAGTQLTMIAGDVTLRKRFLIWDVADIPLGGDGIVTRSSQLGYVGSGGYGAAAFEVPELGDATQSHAVECTVTMDELLQGQPEDEDLLSEFRRGVGGILADLGDLTTDAFLVLASGLGTNPTGQDLKLAAVSALAGVTAPCGHQGMLSNPEAHAQIVQGLHDMVAAAVPKETVLTTLRPVNSAGEIQEGWTVTDTHPVPVDCYAGGEGALDPAIVSCGFGADGLNTCWVDETDTAGVCSYTPFARNLVSIQVASVTRSATEEYEPIPAGLVLDNGLQFTVRHGAGNRPSNGASSEYVDMYVSGPNDNFAIWGIYSGDNPFLNAFDRSQPLWTVELGDQTGPSTSAHVVEAIYYGIA